MTESNTPTLSPLWYVAFHDGDTVHGFFIAEATNHLAALAMAGHEMCGAPETKGAAIPAASYSVYYPHRNRFIPWDEAVRIFGIPRPDEDWALPREAEIN